MDHDLHRPFTASTRCIWEIQGERAVATGLPHAVVREIRRHARSAPQQNQIEVAGVACAEKRAHPMNWNRDQERQEVLGKQKYLHREDQVKQQRRERNAPAHRRPRDRDEKDVRRESLVALAHDLHPEHATHPGHDLRRAKSDGDADHSTDRPTPRNSVCHRHAA